MAGPHPIAAAKQTFENARTGFGSALTQAGALSAQAGQVRQEADKAIAEAAKTVAAPPFPPAAADSLQQAKAAAAAIKAADDAKAIHDQLQAGKQALDQKLTDLKNAKNLLDQEIATATPTSVMGRAWAAISSAYSSLRGFEPPLVESCPTRGQDLQNAENQMLGVPAAAANKAAIALAEAQQNAKTAVDNRLAQLRAEGHGPQRHSDPDDLTLKRRALYGMDPETACQIENVPPPALTRLHAAADCASKFRTPEDYVKAELAMRQQLMNQVCPPGGPPAATPVDRKKLTPPPALTTVFADPDKHCKGFSAVNPPPMVMTSRGPARQVPPKAGLPPPPYVHPPAPAIPPLVLPGPPPAHSNAQADRYLTVAQNAMKGGGDPQAAIDELARLGGTKTHMPAAVAAGIAAVPPPRVLPSDAVAAADVDNAVVDAYASDPLNTTAASFAAGTFTAIFDPVDPNQPCGEWKLLTMYPNP